MPTVLQGRLLKEFFDGASKDSKSSDKGQACPPV